MLYSNPDSRISEAFEYTGGAGYKDRQVVVYMVQQVAGYKGSLFLGPRKWLFIRSHFLLFRWSNFFFEISLCRFFPEMARYKV